MKEYKRLALSLPNLLKITSVPNDLICYIMSKKPKLDVNEILPIL